MAPCDEVLEIYIYNARTNSRRKNKYIYNLYLDVDEDDVCASCMCGYMVCIRRCYCGHSSACIGIKLVGGWVGAG